MVCVICGGVYDKSCFERFNNTRTIGNHLVICPDHGNITSNHDESTLNEETRKLFAQLRLSLISETREMILKEIEEEDIEDCDEENIKSELQSAVKENKMLKLLNSELQDKNLLLKEHIEQMKQTKNHVHKTYSQVITGEIREQKKIPKIVIRKKDRTDGNDPRRSVKHYLNKGKAIQTKKVIFKTDSEIIISCLDETSVIEAEKSLNKKLSNYCTIEKEKVKKPRIKVVGIDNMEGMDVVELEEDINMRNFNKMESKCTIIHSYENKKTKLQSIILEVTAEIYKHVRENANRIFVGYQNCKVYDDLNLQPCFNCGRFGHSGNKCVNEKVCLKCAGSHYSVNCNKQDVKCCVNCLYSNNKYNTQYNTQHIANDSQSCQVLINKIKKYISNTDYPMSPIIQRYVCR